jgi:hypothetical protein
VNWTHVTIIVPHAHVSLARQLAAAAADSGVGMFLTGLSASGAEPATHWISSGLIQQEFADLLKDPQAVADLAQGQVPLSAVQAMLTASVIREGENPHDVISECGLALIGEPL